MFRHFVADNFNQRSVASRLRQKRFELFSDMINRDSKPICILDVGGTQSYWELMTNGSSILGKVEVTLLNIDPQKTSLPNIASVKGDARAMPQFADQQFDIVYSNSTIEHVGNWDDQKNMAKEVKRVGKQYFIQTPNRNFPIEPHFLFPFFQFLPINMRVWLVQNFRLGWYPRIIDRQKALAEIMDIRLMTKFEVQTLFPEGEIIEEKYLGLTKSFIAHSR